MAKDKSKKDDDLSDIRDLINIANKAAKSSEGCADDEDVAKICSDVTLNVQTFSTGSLALDLATGVGGIPRGRVIEIYGPESCGKTTICLGIIADLQHSGRAAFIDMEHALDPQLAKGVGVNLDRLVLAQPKHGEQCFAMVEALVATGKLDLIVVDSVAAMVPKAELEGEMTDANMAAQARLMGKGLRKITGLASKSNTTVIFINQIREKTGVMYGSNETTPGGRALKFFSSMRLDIRRKKPITSGSTIIGNHTNVKVVKNKVAPPHTEAEVTIMFGKGVDNSVPLVKFGVDYGFIACKGSFYSYGDNNKQNGIDNFIASLRENNQYNDLMNKIRVKMKETVIPDVKSHDDGEDPADGEDPEG